MKKSQIDTENDKKTNVSKVQKLCAVFRKVSTEVVDCNGENSQQGQSLLSSCLSENINAVFSVSKSRIDIENDK